MGETRVQCDAGFACSVGSSEQKPCLPGSFGDRPELESCTLCAAGKFTDSAANTGCFNCTVRALGSFQPTLSSPLLLLRLGASVLSRMLLGCSDFLGG